MSLLEYFTGGAVICPYALRARYAIVTEADFEPSKWVNAVAARSVAVVVASDENRTFEEARAWALAAHARICRELGTEPIVHLGKALPHIEVGTFTAYAIAMGPQYPERHPRYAPRLCLAAVNDEAVREVSEDARAPIRRAMLERTNALYDADEVWLAIEPEDQRRRT